MSTSANNWDPVLLISQIVSMQTLHYLTLSLLTPPLLATFAEPESLAYEGGAANVGMLMDWREMAGRPALRDNRWSGFTGGGKLIGSAPVAALTGASARTDPIRGWVIAACWLAASAADVYYLVYLIRRPRLILDFSLTLAFNHLLLTTYYAAALPSSWFFWLVIGVGTAGTVITAEQICVRREMRDGLQVANVENEVAADEMEMGSLLIRRRSISEEEAQS